MLVEKQGVTHVHRAGWIDDHQILRFDRLIERNLDVESLGEPLRSCRSGRSRSEHQWGKYQMQQNEEQGNRNAAIRHNRNFGRGPSAANTAYQNRTNNPKAPKPTNISRRSVGNVAQIGITESSMPW